MKTFPINTQNKQIVSCSDEKNVISNVYSFPTFSGTTKPSFSSTSTDYKDESEKNIHESLAQDYAINLDWLQFVVSPSVDEYSIDNYNDQNLQIEKIRTHHNTNFITCHKVIYKGIAVLDIFSNPINHTHKKGEMCVKVCNHILYQSGCLNDILDLMGILNLRFERLSRIAIALDGRPNFKILGYLTRYLKTKTIQINNDILEITPFKFKKNELKWEGFSIGKRRSQKFARVYNKSNELKSNDKHYIIQYWEMNRIDYSHNDVTRFELELGYKHLKKYNLKDISDFFDAGFIAKLFQIETEKWLRFYKVKLQDIKDLRKDKAIQKGKEIHYIMWNKLPSTTIKIDTIQNLPEERINAKKNITFSIEQIRKNPKSNVTHTHIDYIATISGVFGLNDFVFTKIDDKFPNILFDKDHPMAILKARCTMHE